MVGLYDCYPKPVYRIWRADHSRTLKSLGVSVPYTTKTLNELIDIGLVQVTGKKDNYSKRAPKIYDLIATSGYFLGIDTGKDNLTFGICDFAATW